MRDVRDLIPISSVQAPEEFISNHIPQLVHLVKNQLCRCHDSMYLYSQITSEG